MKIVKMDLTKAKLLHHKLWMWLSKNPTRIKEEWPEWKPNGGQIPVPRSYCFLCEFFLNTGICAVVWNQKRSFGSRCLYSYHACIEPGSIYLVWKNNHGIVRKNAAAKIAKLWK